MCIAILNPNDVTLEKSILKTCWDNNKDGAGLLYLKDKKLTAHKEMKNFDKFYNHYLSVRKDHAESQVVIHFRIGTHGRINLENCHPFITNDKWGFVHNGMISSIGRDKDKSDTNLFNELVLKKLPVDWIHNDAIYELVSGYIGGSKLLFLNTDNDAYIINEEAGVWDMGCWFSNTTYKIGRYLDVGGRSMPSFRYSRDDNWEDTDWERKYKWNPKTRTYDKREDFTESDDFTDYGEESGNPFDKPDFNYSRDTNYERCESCLEDKLCVYDETYQAPLCRVCCDAMYDGVAN